ncbi:uncharacterized protein CANTADRAFT_18987 [Suhomyces tanzawaensis NRRL Y-17324]|uniref:Uncharacterized protein n=1 Tax=Suhomyces tanzawaensis NRRL Y-17324 TaxID=984487 RepID=A0A1E4SP94_9ASCO|nr:uncharacterized protein CANTADRAFT_18987 [Suhomyces tanzawaensis NRRL Y-17324]ODV81333.1 hypothetical protein CANTADRAFT_18987 [Suhomyces tanzawaensis NRRL Y-17324]
MSEDKQSFLGKLKKPFKTHSRSSSSTKSLETGHSDVVDAAYSEGKKAGHNPENSPIELAYIEGHNKGSGSDDVVKQAYQEGHHQGQSHGKSHGAYGAAGATSSSHGTSGATSSSSHGTSHSPSVVASSHVGRVVTSPPPVKREPVTKDLSGDFTNEKNPLDRSLIGKERDPEYNDPNCLHENSNPDYANDATNDKGTGYFFDPKDTQGGVYGDSAGPYDEATRAKLERNKNLKTQPAAYAAQAKQEQELEAVKDSSYAEGVKAAHRDTSQASSSAQASSSQALAANASSSANDNAGKGTTLDPSEEHSRNKSAFNSSGVTTAKKDLGVATAAGGAATAAAVGAGSHSGSNSGKHASNTSSNAQPYSGSISPKPALKSDDKDAARQFAKSGAYDSTLTSHTNDKSYTATAVPPSSKDFDYESELKKLDRQIDQTQNEIENLKSSNVSTTGVYNQDLASDTSKSLDPHSDHHSGAAGAGALAGASGVLAAAASYVGLGGKSYDASEHPVVHEAYEAGLKAGKSSSGAARHSSKTSSGSAAGYAPAGYSSSETAPLSKSTETSHGASQTAPVSTTHNTSQTAPVSSTHSASQTAPVSKSVETHGTSHSAPVSASKSLDPHSDHHSGAAGAGALAGASGVLAAAASYVGLGGKSYDASEHPVVHEAYEEGLKAGKSNSGAATGYSSNQAAPVSKSVETTHGSGQTAPVSKSVETTNAPGQTVSDSRNTSAGIFGGAASAASAIAAGTLGFGSGSSHEDRDLKKSELTSEDAYVKTSGKATGLDQVNADGSQKPGFFDGATGALSAAAAAAGFGGAAAATSSSDPVHESYDAGKVKAKENIGTSKSAEIGTTHHKSSDSPQKPILDDVDDKSDTRTSHSSNSGISGYLAGAAGAIGLPYGSDSKTSATATSTSTDPHAKSSGLVGAVDGHEDVAKAKAHPTSKDPLKETETDEKDEGDGVQKVPGLTPTEESAKGTSSKDKKSKELESENKDLASSGNSNKGILASAGAAVGGVAGALGVSGTKSGVPAPGESLIATAERVDDDVAKAKPHTTGKSALTDSGETNDKDDGVQQVPGLVPASEKDDSNAKGKDSGSSKMTEAEVDAYNKKHGFNKNDKRSLVEIAEHADPEIKNLSSHHGKSVTEDGDEEVETKDGDVQPLPTLDFKQNDFIRTGGKEGSLSDPVDSKSSPHQKNSNPTNKKQENQAYATGHSAKDPHKEHINPADKIDRAYKDEKPNTAGISHDTHQETSQSDSSNYGYGAGLLGAGAGAVGGAISYLSGGKKADTHTEHSNTVSDVHGESNPRQRTAPQSKEVKNEAYSEGLKAGAYESGNVAAAKDVSSLSHGANTKDLSSTPYNEGLQAGAYESGNVAAAKDVSNQSHNSNSKGLSSNTGLTAAGVIPNKDQSFTAEDHKEFYAAGVHKAAYEHGHDHGRREHEDSKHQASDQGFGTGADSKHQGINRGAVAGGAVGGAAIGAAGSSALGHSSSNSSRSKNSGNKDELLVEVIGVSDKEEASKIARSASKDLSKQGVDLSSGKLVINANTREIYKTDTDQPAQSLVQDEKNASSSRASNSHGATGAAAAVGAAGAAGVVAGSQAVHHDGFGSGSKSLREEDIQIPQRQDLTSADPSQPNKFHDEHEKAKERLSRAANEGHLGNVAPATSTHESGKKEDVLVNVRGTKSNTDATKIATGAIQSLKQSKPEVLANAKQLNVDSTTGIITDEVGNFVASTNEGRSTKSGLSNETRSGLSNETYDSSALQNKSGRTTDISGGQSHGGLTHHGNSHASGVRGGLSSETYDSSALHNKQGVSTNIGAGNTDAYTEPSIGSYPAQNHGLSGSSAHTSAPRETSADFAAGGASGAYNSKAVPSENVTTGTHSQRQEVSQTGHVNHVQMPGSFIP